MRSAEGGAATRVNVLALESELRSRVRGEVRFSDGDRALYATDSSNYRQTPIGVVLPLDADDVVEAVASCRHHGAPLLPRGCGTSLAGQCCNVAVVLDTSKYMNRLLGLDPERQRARIQPGIILDTLRIEADKHRLTFGPDPATHTHCTLGGMIGNDSCGVHSIEAGLTSDNVDNMEILTYDGLRMRVGATPDQELEQIIAEGGRRGQIFGALRSLRDRYADQIRARYPRIPRRVSGYNLPELLPESGFNVARALVGSEGTCVTVLDATTHLVYSPPVRSLVVLGYPDACHAADHVMEILAHKPIGLEGFDDRIVTGLKRKQIHSEKVGLLPPGGGWLLAEFGGETRGEAESSARELMQALGRLSDVPAMKLFLDPEEQNRVWTVRESSLGATAHIPGEKETWEGWEDSAVPPERLGGYLRDQRRLMDRYGYHGGYYGHFGQGCVHLRIDFDLTTVEGIARFRSFVYEAADLCISYGGSLSGEHGDGQARGELLPRMFGEELVGAFREFKSIWDPEWKMNPGKLVDANRLDADLRLGTGYNPPVLSTEFAYPDDHGSFAEATLRCVGVGKCRRLGGGTMCPSFMVTLEEEHSTRGRARLLFEMLRGEVVTEGWKAEKVHEALDLCLACKGCKGDCPINVDMATYKAEFLSHYYEGRLRPRTAYFFGLIMYWSRLASVMPGMVNLFTQLPLLRDVAKAVVGVAPERRIPAFASRSFKQRFRSRRLDQEDGWPRVILWPDTFNNYFHPETALAAVEVLEAAGFHVEVPERDLCCGRPLYDYGMLGLAKRMLRQVLDTLGPQIQEGIPVVGLEPSCAAVFREELLQLFPNDENARRLSQQCYTLGEFLDKRAPDLHLPALHRKALVHGHCHQKSILGMEGELGVLRRLGVECTELDSGCCGMAGAFGFEADHYDVAQRVGERVLLPAVRSAPLESLIVADGFSCREQIEQGTDREALHLAQVIKMALREGPSGPQVGPPERAYGDRPAGTTVPALLLAAGLAAGAAVVAWRRRP